MAEDGVIELTENADLTEIASQNPAIIYKHSPACWMSSVSARQIRKFVKKYPDTKVYWVDVIEQRDLSQRVAEHFAIEHESPQSIVVGDGRVLWHGSHGAVNVKKLAKAISEE
ncbi:MAG: bacillithiol system redox-active protein YtxJ [Gemmatimonadales bacterium]